MIWESLPRERRLRKAGWFEHSGTRGFSGHEVHTGRDAKPEWLQCGCCTATGLGADRHKCVSRTSLTRVWNSSRGVLSACKRRDIYKEKAHHSSQSSLRLQKAQRPLKMRPLALKQPRDVKEYQQPFLRNQYGSNVSPADWGKIVGEGPYEGMPSESRSACAVYIARPSWMPS